MHVGNSVKNPDALKCDININKLSLQRYAVSNACGLITVTA